MVEDNDWLHVPGAQRIDHSLVVHEGCNVEIALRWFDTTPFDREAVCVEAQRLHTLDRLNEYGQIPMVERTLGALRIDRRSLERFEFCETREDLWIRCEDFPIIIRQVPLDLAAGIGNAPEEGARRHRLQ